MVCNYKNIKCLLILLILVFSILTFTSCGSSPTADTDIQDDLPPLVENELDEEVKTLTLDFLSQEMDWIDNIYFAPDEPSNPQHGDCRIDEVTYLGRAGNIYAYRVDSSFFQDEWIEYRSPYLMLEGNPDNKTWAKVLGSPYNLETFPQTEKDIKTIILEYVHGLWNIEASVKFDGSQAYGENRIYQVKTNRTDIETFR